MAQGKIRVRLKSYDSTIIDAAAAKVVDVAKRNGSKVSGPIPLPTDKEIVTILRAVHKYKDSREQFEMRTFVSDGQVYESSTFADLIQKELGNPWLLRIKCPLCLLKVISVVAEFGAKCAGKTSTLNRDKYNIMKQRNWQCDISPLVNELGFHPEYLLERGVKETIAWYKKEGWL